MKKLLLTVIILLHFTSCDAQKSNLENDFYVINVLGAELYEKPSLNSKVLLKIKVGEKLIAKEIIKTEQSKIIGKGFSFSGNFIKIHYKSYTGYIFSSDLTKIKPSIKVDYDGILVADIMGIEKGKRIEKRYEKFDGKEYEIEDEITEYENGSYTYTAFDGCFDHVYIFKNMTLNEVYHQLINLYFFAGQTENGRQIEIPKFFKKTINEYYFNSIDATQDLKLIDNQDGRFTISSYDCT